jgi:hypothetical protein
MVVMEEAIFYLAIYMSSVPFVALVPSMSDAGIFLYTMNSITNTCLPDGL